MSSNHVLRKALLVFGVTVLCLAGTAGAKTLHVDASVAVTGDGSAASPFKTIGEAITASVAGDEIRIAGGVYENESPQMTLKAQQTISGSYDSTFTRADVAENPTVIDMAHLTQQQQNRTFRCQAVTSFTIENLVIRNSSTGESGNTTNGGAIYVQNGSSGTIRHVSFLNCTSQFEGGAENGPARDGGALCIRDGSVVTVEDCVFDGCTAVGNGGAICMRNAGAGNNVKIHRCLFTRCGSRNGASSIQDADSPSQIEIVNSIFAGNGVGVVVPSGIAPSNYEIRIADRRAVIYNCTFIDSNNPDGFVFNMGDSADGSAAKEIVNCIIANNTIAGGGETFALFSYASGYNDATTLQNNLFFSNSGLDPLDPAGAAVIGVNGNIAGDPQFADAAGGDYRLKAGSPGLDAGRTLSLVPNDFAGTVRPVGAAYDIGALEGEATENIPSYEVLNVTATASSSLKAESGPGKTVDGSGLNDADQHETAGSTMWISAVGQQPPVWIQYEFDKVYKLDRMWVWNSNNDLEWLVGLGVKTATIECSTDGIAWTALANVPQFAQGPAAADYAHNTTVDFGGVPARFVRVTCTSNWGGGGQYSLSEVRFFYIPVLPRTPDPATKATGVSLDAVLSWEAGCEAASHEIHLGTDPKAVADGTAPIAVVSEPAYAPGNLQLETTYYWKVVEVNQAASPSAWAGEVWSFSTSPYAIIDDFESYTNDSPKRVFQAWVDGLGFSADEFFPNGNNGNGTGALVGYDPASGGIMERKIMHGGRQSMPFVYDGLSETTRTFSPAQDWTRGGIKTLVLFFCGVVDNGPGELYVKINNARVSYSGAAADLASTEWKQWNIDLPSNAGLGAVRTMTIGVSAGQGTLYFDDLRLYRSAPAVNP